MSDTVTPTPRLEVGGWIVRAVFLVLSILIIVGAIGYGIRDDEGLVGAGMMPFAAGLVMLVATLWEGVGEFRRQRTALPQAPVENAIADADAVEATTRTPAEQRRAVITSFVVILATLLVARVVGLLIALSLMVLVLIWPVERKPWWSGVIGGVAAFLFGWLVFGVLLDVPLPTGMLGLI